MGDVKIKVTVSIGVAKQKNTSSTFDSILRKADMALYEAKSQGKNCVETASS
ncbi:diguanylate cyclase [Brucella pituitosa]|uniref:diguanylate cyclase n=1 Tax=Brucella pituitosa TaxID=571256 RepID=UPI003F4AB83E